MKLKRFTPIARADRWRLLKRGKHLVTLCNRVYFYSGALISLGIAMAGLSGPALAEPQGGNVTSGSADIGHADGELQIRQNTHRVVIEWDKFNINTGETTRFIQPSSSALALNRVLAESQISFINGNLIANGRIIIINPNGVLESTQDCLGHRTVNQRVSAQDHTCSYDAMRADSTGTGDDFSFDESRTALHLRSSSVICIAYECRFAQPTSAFPLFFADALQILNFCDRIHGDLLQRNASFFLC